jgi:hypothetical protein
LEKAEMTTSINYDKSTQEKPWAIKTVFTLGVVVHAYNLSTWEAKAGKLWVKDHPCLKKQNKTEVVIKKMMLIGNYAAIRSDIINV